MTTIPNEIILHAINEKWTVHYMACNAKLEMFQRPAREIVLVGKPKSDKAWKSKLTDWLKQQAHTHLLTHLQTTSHTLQLNYSQVNIRDQRTIWGSCTSKHAISLNYKLIFLPTYLMTHVLIHELCHTKYLNHSPKFWDLVAQHDVKWREHRRELRQAGKYIPSWLG